MSPPGVPLGCPGPPGSPGLPWGPLVPLGPMSLPGPPGLPWAPPGPLSCASLARCTCAKNVFLFKRYQSGRSSSPSWHRFLKFKKKTGSERINHNRRWVCGWVHIISLRFGWECALGTPIRNYFRRLHPSTQPPTQAPNHQPKHPTTNPSTQPPR